MLAGQRTDGGLGKFEVSLAREATTIARLCKLRIKNEGALGA